MSKFFTGTVISTKMQNAVVVQVERRFRHALYKKVISRRKKFHAHNEMKDIHEGDTVKIQETKPISKTIHFIVVEKLKK